MRFSSHRVRLRGFLVILLFAGFGCDRIGDAILGKDEKTAEMPKATRPALTFEEPQLPKDSPSLLSREAPPDFPKSIPLYPGATVVSGTSYEEEDQKVRGVGLKTTDSADKVVAFYKAKFGDQRYQDTNDIPNNPVTGTVRVLIFEDAASGSTASVMLQAPNGGETSVQLSASKKMTK